MASSAGTLETFVEGGVQCPVIYHLNAGPNGDAAVPLPLRCMRVDAAISVATAFVTISAKFSLPARSAARNAKDCLLAVPLCDGAIVSDVEVRTRRSVHTTLIVAGLPDQQSSSSSSPNSAADSSPSKPRSHPNLFTLKLPNTSREPELSLRLHYFQPLRFVNGRYTLRIPLTLPRESLADKPVSQVLSVRCKLSSSSPKSLDIMDLSMPVRTDPSSTPTSIALETDPSQAPLPNTDFTVSYQIWGETINCACLIQHAEGQSSSTGLFGVSIAPPSPDVMRPFVRSVVFCIDKSGSMTGHSMKSANRALLHALKSLAPEDEFEIIAFNHQTFTFSGHGLKKATKSEKEKASSWVNQMCVAGGLTNIMRPMWMGLDRLDKAQGLPYVFLITDGAVSDERDICRAAMHRVGSCASGRKVPRISTFGIGQLCNHYFLKQLAKQGRGISELAFSHDRIEEKMERMLDASARPILADVTLGIQITAQNVELYPDPLPDLYSSLPVVVSGRCTGVLPSTISISGVLPDGNMWSQDVQVYLATGEVPLQRVFAKQQIDLLSADAWLKEDVEPQEAEALKNQVQALSIQQSIPSPYTNMVAFEAPHKKYKKQIEPKKRSGQGVRAGTIGAVAIGGAAGIAAVGLVTGGFGDVAATASNAISAVGNAGPALAEFTGDLGAGCTGCAACGADACSGLGVGACGEACAGCATSIGAGFTACFECIGGCFSSIPFDDIGDCCSNAIESIAEVLKAVLS